jgi:hypothetical protein
MLILNMNRPENIIRKSWRIRRRRRRRRRSE